MTNDELSGNWKPISEYPTTPGEQGPVVLARCKERVPCLVVYVDGNFVVCPSMFIHYGDKKAGLLYANHVTEFMPIPA